MTPLKLYPAYKASGVEWLGDVPSHWEVRQLGRIGRFSKGSGGTKKDESAHGIPCIRYGDLYTQHQFFITESRTFVTRRSAAKYTPIRYGDVLFAGSGETIDEIGKSAVNLIRGPVCCGGDVIIFRPSIHVDARFLGYATDCPQAVCQKACMGRGITVMHIYWGYLKYMEVAFPPLLEQATIARFLDDADWHIRRYIREKQKLIKLLEEQKQAVIHRAVTCGLDPNVRFKPSEVDGLNDVPEHWERWRLKSLLRPIDRRSITGTETLLSLRRDFGVVPYSDHFARPAQSKSLVGFKLVAADQFVVNRLQANNGLVFCSTLDGLVSPDYSVFDKKEPVRMQFLSEMLRTSTYRVHFRRVATGPGTGTSGFLRLYDNKLLETLVYLPRVEEQTAILEYLDKAALQTDTAIARAHRKIDLLEEYRTRLIADVVTGKVDVREAAVQLPDETDDQRQECEVMA